MQQFTVPQFIDVEDKIIGPLTTRQFLIMLSAFFLIGICYKIFDFSLFITLSIIIFAVFGIFAFLKVNGRPFHFFVLNFIQTLKRPHLRVWRKTGQINIDWLLPKTKSQEEFLPKMPRRLITKSRLAELALIVDTRGAYRGELTDNAE